MFADLPTPAVSRAAAAKQSASLRVAIRAAPGHNDRARPRQSCSDESEEPLRLADLNRWQWMVLGLLLGAAVGFAWRGVEPSEAPTISRGEFNRRLGDTRDTDAGPMPEVRRVTLHPPTQDAYGDTITPVTLQVLTTADGTPAYEDRVLYAPHPYGRARLPQTRGGTQFDTVHDYLAARAGRDPGITFRTAWERAGNTPVFLGAAGGFVLLGLGVPLLLGVAGRRDRSARPASPVAKPSSPAPSSIDDIDDSTDRTTPTPDDLTRLDALNEALEASTRGLSIGADHASPAPTRAGESAPPAVRVLDASAPVDRPADQPTVPADTDATPARTYTGEWYPVARGRADRTGDPS
jgi:hypothetical protein